MRRSLCRIDWKHGIFGHFVTVRGRTGHLWHLWEASWTHGPASNLRFKTACCWCESESDFKMDLPDK
jgi:hypothetical protein